MTKFFALLCLILCLSGFQANAQSRQVSGKVSDIKTNEPLIGVSVRLKGTNAGTSTDVSGNFRLTITGSNPVLSVSYTGYQSKEVPVASQQTFDIKLQEDAQAL